MRIKIVDEPVRQNVEVFLQIMRRAKQKQLEAILPTEKGFRAWLNRDTGQLFFAEVSEESQYLGKKQWKPVEFSYRYDPNSGEIQFLVKEAEQTDTFFRSDDLAPIAFRILRETMKTLSEIGQRLKGPSDLNTKIAVLTKATIEAGISHVDRNVLIDSWHPGDRLQAEALLLERPEGTYLFRKDAYADILEDQLQKQLGKKIKCFTLTYSGEESKVSDLTLVHMDGTWQVYNDDPLLQQEKFLDLKDLVASLKNVLKYPLYHQ